MRIKKIEAGPVSRLDGSKIKLYYTGENEREDYDL